MLFIKWEKVIILKRYGGIFLHIRLNETCKRIRNEILVFEVLVSVMGIYVKDLQV